RYQDIETGDGRGARAGADDLDVADVLVHDLERVQQPRANDDGGAVLIVMEYRNLHALAQLLLDIEALGRLDVLKVDAAEGRFQGSDDFDQFFRIFLVDLDIEDVDAGEFLEQYPFAFHHRFGSQRADIAQAE